MPELEIHLLGRFLVRVDGAEVPEQRWSRKKSKTLLKLLALATQHRMHREQLATELWPDMDAEPALSNLHKVIHAARRTLEPDLAQGLNSRFLLTQEAQVSLAPGVWIDLDEFESRATEALKAGSPSPQEAISAALALHTGDLLEEDLYEDWASVRREQVKGLRERLLERQARLLEAAGDAHAIEALEKLLDLNRVNEDALRRLMRLYQTSGQRHLALERYRLTCEALKTEVDAEPEAATRELFDQIVSGVGGPPLPPPLPPASIAAPITQPTPASPGRRNFLIAAGILVVLGAGTAVYLRRPPRPAAFTPPQSLAILPFRTPGNSEDEKILADGVTEGLINSASRLPGIRVMARATVFAYQGRADGLNIGRELKVAGILSGRVAREGDSWRVSMELIDTADGARLWGRQFFSVHSDLTGLQQTLNSELAAVLAAPVTPEEHRRQQVRPTQNTEAYQLYLRGRYFANQRTAEGLRKAVDNFRKAVDIDSRYGLAWAGLADGLGLLGIIVEDPREFMPQSRKAAEQALELDDNLAEAHTSLAMVNALYEWNWDKAEAEFRRAIMLNDGYATAHHWYGVHLSAMGRFAEAEKELGRAAELDPLSPIIQLNRGYPALYQKRFGDALQQYARALELRPDFAIGYQDRATVQGLQHDDAGAVDSIIRYLQLSGETELATGFEQAAKRGGYRGGLAYWLATLEKRGAKQYVPPLTAASIAARLGEKEKCYQWLERALQQRAGLIVYIGVDPVYEPLRAEPRFRNILQKIGLLVQ